jgi:hypothetical protein
MYVEIGCITHLGQPHNWGWGDSDCGQAQECNIEMYCRGKDGGLSIVHPGCFSSLQTRPEHVNEVFEFSK